MHIHTTQTKTQSQALLGRIMDLLQGFIARPHHSLASVGVAASTRLVVNAGISFTDATWLEVVERLGDVVDTSLPDVQGVCVCEGVCERGCGGYVRICGGMDM